MELELSGHFGALLGANLVAFTWLLTYSFHSALSAGAVALLVRWRLSSALRHAAWKAALFGPLMTTLLALVPRSFDGVRLVTTRVPELAIVSLRTANAAAISHGLLGSFVLAAGLFGLLRQVATALRLSGRLGQRRQVEDRRLLERLAQMRARFALPAITLTESTAIDCPLVLGVSEICIPQSTLSELGDAEVDAVFAHELAHLERHDGIWFPLVGLLNAALWWHPLTRWVSVQVRQSAERACDDRCVQLTGEPRALARALARIAARGLALDPARVLPTMTHPRSSLVARVAHLTSGVGPAERAGSACGGAGLVVGLASIAAVCVASVVRVAAARPAAPRTPGAIAQSAPELARQMNALGLREQSLEIEQRSLSARSADPNALRSDSVRALEVEQELRHIRETQLFIEANLVSH